MLRMQNVFLRSSNTKLSLKLAFSKLKANNLQVAVSSTIAPDSANITNKALYLDYVQQVLKNKEADLMQLQKELSEKQSQLYDSDFKKGVGQMIVQMESIKLIEKKLRNIQEKMGIRDQDYLVLYRKFQADCAKCKTQMEEAFKREYSDLITERKIMREKLGQFAELQSYEKYLNQLHNALEIKSQELAEKQSMLSHQFEQLQQVQQADYQTQGKQTQQSNNSNRKRIKIFNTKPHYPSEERSQFTHNQTFAKWQQNDRHSSQQHAIENINQSSAILGEDSKDDIPYYQRMEASKQQISMSKEFVTVDKSSSCRTIDTSVQVDSENLNEMSDRLRKQSLLLKFSKKWMKHAFDSNKTSITRKKLMAINLWKMNTCFDQGITGHAINSIQALEKMWKKQEKLLYSSQMFPYNELSLKRKRYTELMFDLDQKIYHRKRIEHLLKSIFTQRHRKQRLIFYLYFCRFVKNSSGFEKTNKNKQKSKLTVGSCSNTNLAQRSDLISMSSSHILQEQHINLPKKKSATSLVSNNKSQQISKQASSQKLSNNQGNKQNSHESKNDRIEKMKETIAEKQRIEKLLATQCVKLEGLLKMSMILAQCTFKTTNFAMRKIVESEYYDKLNAMETQLSGLEFKFDLVMTKCKLGVANSSNKISTLENLLQFTNLLK